MGDLGYAKYVSNNKIGIKRYVEENDGNKLMKSTGFRYANLPYDRHCPSPIPP